MEPHKERSQYLLILLATLILATLPDIGLTAARKGPGRRSESPEPTPSCSGCSEGHAASESVQASMLARSDTNATQTENSAAPPAEGGSRASADASASEPAPTTAPESGPETNPETSATTKDSGPDAGGDGEAENADAQEQDAALDTELDAELEAELDAELEAELDALEEEVGQQQQNASGAQRQGGLSNIGQSIQSMNPDISFILDATAAWLSDPDAVDLRGGHDPQSPGFNLQALELAVETAVDPYFTFNSAIVISLFGIEIEEAFLTTLSMPWQMQARVGQFKTRFGRLNPTHMHAWAFITQPLVNAKFFGGESMRGLGAELSQLVLAMPGTFRWRVAVQNVSGAATGRSFLPSSSDVEGPLDLTLSARAEDFFELTYDWDLLLGASFATGRNKSGRGNRTDVYGADLLLRWVSRSTGGRSAVSWQSELMARRRQIPNGVLEDFGLYSHIHWRLNRFWTTGVRYEYVSGIDPRGEQSSFLGGSLFGPSGPLNVVDPLDPQWIRARQRGAAQVSWTPTHFSRIRLQYTLDHLPYREQTQMPSIVQMAFLQFEVVTGAHGAHTY
mgnify:CR=1 FL=1